MIELAKKHKLFVSTADSAAGGKVPRKRGTTIRKAQSSQRVANQPSGEGEHLLAFDDRIVPLVFQSNKRARRIIIRLDHFHARVVVVLPSRATRDQGRRFALLNKGWISDRLAALPPAVPLRSGALVPYLGIPHRIRHRPGERGTVWREEGEIHVAGRPEHSKRRIEEWLKREARREIERRVWAKAELQQTQAELAQRTSEAARLEKALNGRGEKAYARR